jgi:tetratricopeptide (TPR) repeat protein
MGSHNKPCKDHSRDYFSLENGAVNFWRFRSDRRLEIQRYKFEVSSMEASTCFIISVMKRLFPLRLAILILAISPESATAQKPTPEEQKYLLSVLPLIESGRLTGAEEKLVAGMQLYPRSAILQNALGIVYQKQNRTEAAAAAFQRALELLPSFTAAQLHLALLYQQQDKKKDAADLFAAVGASTTNFEALATAGLGLAQCEDYNRAIPVLEKAQSLQPDSSSIRYNLALARYKNGNFQAALETLGSIPSPEGAEKADLLYLRGQIRQALSQDESSEDLGQACRLRPSAENFCVDAALALMKQERFASALEILQLSLQDSTSVAFLSTLGLVQFRLGKYREAIESYTRALAMDSTSDASREGLAFLLYITGDLVQARSVVEERVGNPASDFYLSQLHGMILYRLSPKLWSEATRSIDRALEKNPSFAPSYFLRGKIEMERGSLEAALRDFQRAAELDPKYPLPHYKIAQVYIRQGRLQEAEVVQKKFSELGNLREEELLTRQTQDLLMRTSR